jgi:2-polyprenyl-3-methyl-5-hydroxy-6-metoxy-1,4-benzoquinol methylase
MSPAMADMLNYQAYLFSKIRPWIGTRILEIGVGNGTHTQFLLQCGDVLAADIDPACLKHVEENCAYEARLQTTLIDLNKRESIAACGHFRPDTIVCCNVLEHIESDQDALNGLREITSPQGRIALIVPAHPSLFGRMDKEAGHCRRYSRRRLIQTLTKSGWKVERVQYVNALGAVGWWFHNRVRQQAGLSDARVNRQMRSADRWLPRIARLTDPLFGKLFGLSVLGIACNPDAAASTGGAA